MVRNMRDEGAPADRRDRMAIAAAPYLHPRLAAVDHSGKVGWLTHEEALAELK
jgi:hypothetical protein